MNTTTPLSHRIPAELGVGAKITIIAVKIPQPARMAFMCCSIIVFSCMAMPPDNHGHSPNQLLPLFGSAGQLLSTAWGQTINPLFALTASRLPIAPDQAPGLKFVQEGIKRSLAKLEYP